MQNLTLNPKPQTPKPSIFAPRGPLQAAGNRETLSRNTLLYGPNTQLLGYLVYPALNGLGDLKLELFLVPGFDYLFGLLLRNLN